MEILREGGPNLHEPNCGMQQLANRRRYRRPNYVATLGDWQGSLSQLTIAFTRMKAFVPTIVRFDSLASTNTEAAQRALQGAPEGLCVVAEEQTAGRGRLQRDWVSRKGAGLYFSVVLRPRFAQSAWPLLTLMAAVAVHDALLDSCSLETDIKWPNDILVNEKKICGI